MLSLNAVVFIPVSMIAIAGGISACTGVTPASKIVSTSSVRFMLFHNPFGMLVGQMYGELSL